MYAKKKGVVSLTTFSLILVILFVLLTGSYGFYNKLNIDTQIISAKKENMIYALNLRAKLIELNYVPNSTLIYEEFFKYTNAQIDLSNNTISVYQFVGSQKVEVEISSLGVPFCSNYVVYPAETTVFSFDGSCISKLS